jgi:hypothetical protein
MISPNSRAYAYRIFKKDFTLYKIETFFLGDGGSLCVGQGLGDQRPNFQTFMEPKNRFQGTNSARLCRLAGRYENPIPSSYLFQQWIRTNSFKEQESYH